MAGKPSSRPTVLLVPPYPQHKPSTASSPCPAAAASPRPCGAACCPWLGGDPLSGHRLGHLERAPACQSNREMYSPRLAQTQRNTYRRAQVERHRHRQRSTDTQRHSRHWKAQTYSHRMAKTQKHSDTMRGTDAHKGSNIDSLTLSTNTQCKAQDNKNLI